MGPTVEARGGKLVIYKGKEIASFSNQLLTDELMSLTKL